MKWDQETGSTISFFPNKGDIFILEVLSIPSLWVFFKVYEGNDLFLKIVW